MTSLAAIPDFPSAEIQYKFMALKHFLADAKEPFLNWKKF
jgi:hypothetical protein